jgi:N utilization substance protein B
MNEQLISFNALSQRDKRSLLFHLLYAAESYEYQTSIESLVDNLNRGFDFDIPMDSELVATATAIIEQRDTLDEQYKPLLTNWRFDRLGVPTKLILRYAIWELLNTNTAHTVIINEAIELAKSFGEKDSYKFINGILDEMIKKLPQKP